MVNVSKNESFAIIELTENGIYMFQVHIYIHISVNITYFIPQFKIGFTNILNTKKDFSDQSLILAEGPRS